MTGKQAQAIFVIELVEHFQDDGLPDTFERLYLSCKRFVLGREIVEGAEGVGLSLEVLIEDEAP
jgi:hypothetical protein